MGADMIIANIAVPANRTEPPDYAAGRAAIEQLTTIDEHWDIEGMFFEEDPDRDLDAEAPSLDEVRCIGLRIIDDLTAALASRDTYVDEVAGYRLYMSGGLSWGDMPSDAAQAIDRAYCLPPQILQVMGFVVDSRKPLSRTNGNTGAVTDNDVVDALALGLGTRPEWKGGDELEWIANVIGLVRTHPGGQVPADYVAQFTAETGFDPRQDNFLQQFID